MTTSQKEHIKLHPKDNVVVALSELNPGQAAGRIEVLNTVPAGHKLAAANIPAGSPIIKFGQIIGFAARDIPAGEHVHTQNVELRSFDRDYAVGADVRPTEIIPPAQRAAFNGYLRPDGRVGTRNYIGVLPTVSCSASVARFIAERAKAELLERFPNVDGVAALGHGSGCCVVGEGLEVLRRTIRGFAAHPNFAGVVLVGLGCEVNLVDDLTAGLNLDPAKGLDSLVIQTSGGTEAAVRQGVDAVQKLLERADRFRRTSVSAEHLILGLECGGSDAYSGLTANPSMGAAADLVVRNGGTAILSETPEIYGAEHLLTRRAVDAAAADKLIGRIKWWEEYTAKNGAEINNNPTPGNKAGGLTTILEKSLGAISKAGSTNLVEVLEYAQPVKSKGLVFMDSPGYDVVSITGMIAGGANLICFSTGRGTVYGSKPAPTLKLASNSRMYRHLSGDMDVDCGAVIDEGVSIAEMGRRIFDLLLQTASGRSTKSESLGFGDNEFVPWNLGVVM